MVRLERGDVFWELTQRGARIAIRSGKLGRDGRTSEQTMASTAEATREAKREIAARRGEGYAEPAPRQSVGATARKGVSRSDPELAALIAEDPADIARYLVYADWLQQEGDPRGELIVIQHGLATEPYGRRYDELERMESQLFKEFGAELLGPLAKIVNVSTSMHSYRGLAWRCGFVRAMRLTPLLVALRPLLEASVDHPSLRFLEHMVVDGKDLPILVDVAIPPSVSSVHLRRQESRNVLVDDVFWATFPKIHTLGLEATVSAFAPHAGLVSLDLRQATPATLGALGNASFPALQHLALTIALPDDTLDASLARIRQAFPRLRSLTVRRSELDHREVPRPQDPLAGVIMAHAHGLDVRLEMALRRPPPSITHVAEPPEDEDFLSVNRFHHATDSSPPSPR